MKTTALQNTGRARLRLARVSQESAAPLPMGQASREHCHHAHEAAPHRHRAPDLEALRVLQVLLGVQELLSDR